MKRGEIWRADLGYAGKVRPVLILSVAYTDDERAIVTYIPRTTRSWPKSRFDVPHRSRLMKDGAFAVQLIGSIPGAKFHHRIGPIDASTLREVESALCTWLDLDA